MDLEKRNNIIVAICVLLSVVAIIIGVIISLGKDPKEFDLENSISTNAPITRTDESDSKQTNPPEDETNPTTQTTTVESSSQSEQTTEDLPTELTPIEEKVVYSLGANFRDAPDLETSNILSYLDKDTQFTVTAMIGEWYFATINGVEGYVHRDVVTDGPNQNSETTGANYTSVSTRSPTTNSSSSAQNNEGSNINTTARTTTSTTMTATTKSPTTPSTSRTTARTTQKTTPPTAPSEEPTEQTTTTPQETEPSEERPSRTRFD